jgi:hypothetical protein
MSAPETLDDGLVTKGSSMDFLQVMVVSSFDIVFILGELAVEGVGYAAWVVYIVV